MAAVNYRKLSDEKLSEINHEELTNGNRLAFTEELKRRETSEYQEREKRNEERLQKIRKKDEEKKEKERKLNKERIKKNKKRKTIIAFLKVIPLTIFSGIFMGMSIAIYHSTPEAGGKMLIVWAVINLSILSHTASYRSTPVFIVYIAGLLVSGFISTSIFFPIF